MSSWAVLSNSDAISYNPFPPFILPLAQRVSLIICPTFPSPSSASSSSPSPSTSSTNSASTSNTSKPPSKTWFLLLLRNNLNNRS